MAAITSQLLSQRGVTRELAAPVIAACFDRRGEAAAWALGDGTLHIVSRDERQRWDAFTVHDDAIMALAAHPTRGFVTGGSDGLLAEVTSAGEVRPIARFGAKWVEQLATHPSGAIVAGVGRTARVFDASGAALKTLDHPSTVTGLAIDAKGKRLAASHYNGATLWFLAAKVDTPRRLEWKGSHITVALHPAGDAIVTGMQENSLHGWRLADGQHMRMSGYPSKSTSLSFTANGKWLASSGADGIVLWPFTGDGPMGKQPTELAEGAPSLCLRVACHPEMELVAGGFADGTVVVADIKTRRLLPVVPAGKGAASALAWSPEGALLAIGTEGGVAAIVDFAPK